MQKTMIQAVVVADSITKKGDRLTTFIVTFPRIILAEVMTHRMFSRNSASSRAIPFDKMVKSVQENPFIPIAWQKDHKGMQGSEYWTTDIDKLELEWLQARNKAVFQAQTLADAGVTKQLCNRLLEPFMWHTVIITSGKEGLENFFNLRNHEAAEIHIQELAKRMLEVYNESIPKQLQTGEWHIPFSDNIDLEKLPLSPVDLTDGDMYKRNQDRWYNPFKIKVSTARCARVSYTVVGEEGKEPNYENDIKLHDRLVESGHWSPFEHCAKAMSDEEYQSYRKGKHEVTLMDNSENKYWFIEDESGELGWCNNFKGFIQYRYLIENGHS
jgi:thymidylate synthase ThyX